MSQVLPISAYQYTYGAGKEYNRTIEFFRKEQDDPTSLIAVIKGKCGGEWKEGTVLHAGKIEVELFSTTQKVEQMMKARQEGKDMPEFTKQPISQLSVQQQDTILSSLQPVGSRRITICNEPGGLNGLESVVAMTVFDPS